MLKTVIILLLFLFNGFCANSQRVLSELKSVLSENNYLLFEAYLDDPENHFVNETYSNFEEAVSRDIFDQYHESYFQLSESQYDSSTRVLHNVFNVRIISNCDTIIFYEVASQTSHKNEDDQWIFTETIVLTHSDLKRIKRFEQEYIDVYHASLDWSDLFNYDMTYGNSCGLGGGPIKLRKELNTFIANKDTSAILDWLSCGNTVLQLYAMDGVLQLNSKGIQFEDYVYTIIQIISNKEGYVQSCSGCIHMSYSIRAISARILKRHKFKF